MPRTIHSLHKTIKALILKGDAKALEALLATPEGVQQVVEADRLDPGLLFVALQDDLPTTQPLAPGRIDCALLLTPIVERGFTCSFDVKKGWRETALIRAIQLRNLELVKAVAQRSDPLYFSHASEESALTMAMLHCRGGVGREEIVQLLLSQVDPERLKTLNRNGESLLCKAAAQCPPALFQQFLDHGDPRQADAQGWTPLMHAARGNNLDNLNTLLPLSDVFAQESAPNFSNSQVGRTALDLALEIEHEQVVDRLSDWADEATLRTITEHFGQRAPRALARQEALELAAHLGQDVQGEIMEGAQRAHRGRKSNRL